MYQCCIEFIIARDLSFYTFRWIATNPAFYILIEWNTFGISFVHIFFVFIIIGNGWTGNGVSPLSRLVMNLLYLLCLFIICIASI